ncbi:hypothetical protein BDA96_01G384200 [Sorghum bicolor]|uniref:NAC domain-containing protein n=1 Tax=Sorghum bicolor TaxID=4558 RepID=A0A921V069_SORBI|nr:hypothetical protein BDA96_01G384200 [Sorghum bicolor]
MSSLASIVCSLSKLELNLPSGYHFLPTDDELVVYYLRPRLADANHHLPLPIFVHERILNYHPDILIEKYRSYGEGRWFFFTDRERKHVGGNRPNRTTPGNGHWNATGSIRPIRSAGGVLVGCRRTLVFYEASRSRKKKNQAAGLPATEEEGEEEEEEEEEEKGDGGQAAAKATKDGVKTEWTMYEYESLASEAEFEAIRNGNASKMDELVLCTIQKKKHSQEVGQRKKSTKRKTKEEGLELEAVPAAGGGDVEQGGHAAGTMEGQDEDDVQRALMEAAAAAAAAEPQAELAYHAPAAGVDNFTGDPNQNMPYYYLTNSLSPVPAPQQETWTLMPAASGDNNHILMHQENYYFINQSMNIAVAAREYNHTAVMHEQDYFNHFMNMNMRNSQLLHMQATLPQEEFVPYSGTKMAATIGGGSIVEHHMLQQNEIGNVMPAAEAHTFSGFFPSFSNSNYGHLSTTMDHSGPSSVSFPSQQSHGAGSRTGVQGPLLNNQVSLNHQDSDAASTVEYDQRNGVGFTQDHLR